MLFDINQSDTDYLFESAGESVLINNIKTTAILTHPPISEYEQRYIHTLSPAIRGDLVTYSNETYLIISENVTKRGNKYKALIRHCNDKVQVIGDSQQVFVGNDSYGRPVYKTVEGDPILIPAIVDTKSFSVNLNAQFVVPNNQIVVIVQDNATTKSKLTVNGTFPLIEGTWKILNRDLSKKGLVIMTCEKVAS
jgi:hypothetical protein